MKVTDVLELVFEWVIVSSFVLHLMVLVLVLSSGVFQDPVVPLDVLACTNNPWKELPDT